MNKIKLSYNFSAIPLARQRVTRNGHCYNPTTNIKFRQKVYCATKQQLCENFHLIEGRVHCNIIITKTTQTYYKRFGDIDNLIKAIFDSYNGVIWNDDSQVVSLTAKKVTGIRDHFEVEITPLDTQINF